MNHINIYKQIIEKGKTENRVKNKMNYYEKHHIIPKCLGGDNSKDNLVLLTAREHFLVHWLLHLIHPENNKLLSAFHLMCYTKSGNQIRYVPSSRVYEYLKVEKSKRMSGDLNLKYWKGKKRENMSGDNHPTHKNPEIKTKISISLQNHYVSDITKDRISEANKGQVAWNKGSIMKPLSEEHKQKISESNKGKNKVKMSDETKEKIRKIQLENSSSAKKIIQKDKNGKIIEIFNSIAEARKKTGVTRIFDGLKKKREIVNGFKWEYYEE